MERLAYTLSRDGRMAPSTNSKKDIGVVIPLDTIERERDSFVGTVPFLCACVTPLPARGFWEFLHIFNNYFQFDLIFILFFYSLQVNHCRLLGQNIYAFARPLSGKMRLIVSFEWFEFRIFLLLDELPCQD